MHDDLGAAERRFPIARRGYDRSRVDVHLREVEKLRRRDRRQIRELRMRLDALEQELQNMAAEVDRAPQAFLSAVAAKHRLLEEAALSDRSAEDRCDLVGVWSETVDAPLVEAPDLTTRYVHRSAQLPSIGAAADSVLDDLAGLRPSGRRGR